MRRTAQTQQLKEKHVLCSRLTSCEITSEHRVEQAPLGRGGALKQEQRDATRRNGSTCAGRRVSAEHGGGVDHDLNFSNLDI